MTQAWGNDELMEETSMYNSLVSSSARLIPAIKLELCLFNYEWFIGRPLSQIPPTPLSLKGLIIYPDLSVTCSRVLFTLSIASLWPESKTDELNDDLFAIFGVPVLACVWSGLGLVAREGVWGGRGGGGPLWAWMDGRLLLHASRQASSPACIHAGQPGVRQSRQVGEDLARRPHSSGRHNADAVNTATSSTVIQANLPTLPAP